MESNDNINQHFKDFNSCTESMSSFLNLPPPQTSSPPTSHHYPSPTSSSSVPFFNSLPTYINTFPSNPNPSSTTTPSSSSTQPPPHRSKKRSRASRRAPTTVLTTDTSNFRAMVQEFTGFPSPPFAASSPFSPPNSNYLLRPFAQKLSFPSFSPSSIVDAIASTTKPTMTMANANPTASTWPISTSLPSSVTSTLNHQFPASLLNMQSPMLTSHEYGDFGSLLANQVGSASGWAHGGQELESTQNREQSNSIELNRLESSSELQPEKRSKSMHASGEGRQCDGLLDSFL